ncbi:MAG TPA: ABC transporter permease subunit [Mobilitalea sp.]|nr:ABC transporter permease subunit [Mobilitalea sp.]
MQENVVLQDGRQKYAAQRNKLDWIYKVLRAAVLVGIIFLFIPSFNPSRITSLISSNLSLFTSGVSYSQLTRGFGRAFRKEWLSESSMISLMISSLVCCVGIIIQGFSTCATLGNYRLKRIGTAGVLTGSFLTLAGLAGIYGNYHFFLSLPDLDKIGAALPVTFFVLLVVSAITAVFSICLLVTGERADRAEKFKMEPKFQLFLMALPFIALTILFGYLPLIGWRYAFFDYRAGDVLSMDNFVGFKWFTYLLQNDATRNDIVRVMKNTLGMSALGLATSWVSMAFAIFLSEIKSNRYRRFIQTFTTVPNFISWVLIFAVALSIFSADGFISSFMVNIGRWATGENLLMSSHHVWLQMLFWGVWKSLGWGAIVYIAAIAGIDQELYDASKVDGADRFQRMWNITVPELLPTYCVLLLLSIGNILSNGMDQYLVFENSANSASIQVLDLYVYKLGVAQGLIPLTTVVGMLKSVVSIFLVLAANKIAKLVRGDNII